jgi:hypothetical protein
MKPVKISVLSDPVGSNDKRLQKARTLAAKAAEKLKKKTGIELKPSEIMVVTMSPEYEAQFKKKMAEDRVLRSQPPGEPHPKTLIKVLLQNHLAPFLKEKGFRKKARHFWRVQGNVMDVIDLQSSQFNDAWKSKFTINLGVCWIPIQRIIGGVFAVESPPPKVCIFSHRLTPDMEKQTDHWWHVYSTTDIAHLAKDIFELLEHTGFAWMESKRNPNMVRENVTKRWPSLAKKLKAVLPRNGARSSRN